LFSLCDNLCAVLLLLLSSLSSSSSLHCSYTTIITHGFRRARGKITLKLYIIRCVYLHIIICGYSGRIIYIYIYIVRWGSFVRVRVCMCVLGEWVPGWSARVGGCGNQSTVNYFLRSAEVVLTNAHTHNIICARARTRTGSWESTRNQPAGGCLSHNRCKQKFCILYIIYFVFRLLFFFFTIRERVRNLYRTYSHSNFPIYTFIMILCQYPIRN